MLSDLNRSLAENSCKIEHVIVVDGNGIEALPAELAANATVIASARPIGQAAARNLGLLVARGEWITSADDDDWLYPHSIDQRLAAIEGQTGALWAAGYCTDDLKNDPAIVSAGPCLAGDIWRAWPSPHDSIPLGPTTLLVEAALLKRVGGWMGLPQGEDVGMMIAVTSSAPGVLIADYVYHIRLHVGQMTKAAWFDDLELLSRRSAWERGQSILAQQQQASASMPPVRQRMVSL